MGAGCVEISSELARIASNNAERYRPAGRKCHDIRIVNADATTIEFPPTDLLIHLYHPFDITVTTAVLRRLESSLARHPRKVVVAYLLYASAIESVEGVFAQFPWLALARKEQSILGHYDWLFFRST